MARQITIWEIASTFNSFWFQLIPPFMAFFILMFHLYPRLSFVECFWTSFAIGYILVTYLIYIICGLTVEQVDVYVISGVYIFALLVGFIYFAKCVRMFKKKRKSLKDEILKEILNESKWLWFLTALCCWYFGDVYISHILQKDEKGAIWSGGSVWADIAFHLNVITSFLHGKNKHFNLLEQPKSTIYAGYPMSYPFIPDFHSATLVKTGMTIRNSILFSSIAISVSFFVLLYCFTRRVLFGINGNMITKYNGQYFVKKHEDREEEEEEEEDDDDEVEEEEEEEEEILEKNRLEYIYNIKNIYAGNAESFFACCLWFFSGGIGGITMLRDKELTWDTIMKEDWMQNTSNKEPLYWFSSVCHVLLPQRSAMYAYPIDIVIFLFLYLGVTETFISSKSRRNLFLFAGFLTGIIPLVHAHSFVAIGLFASLYALIYLPRTFSVKQNKIIDYSQNNELSEEKKKQEEESNHGLFINWFQFGIPIIICAFPQIRVYLTRLHGGDSDGHSFIKFQALWRNNPWNLTFPGYDKSFVLLDPNAIALWVRALGLMVPLAIIGYLFLRKKQKKLYLCFWIIFVVANFIMFQPWDKDNNKLFLIWLFMACGVVSLVLSKIWNIKLFFSSRIIVTVIFLSLITSGLLISVREYHLRWQYMDKEDQQFANWLVKNTEHDATFISNQSHIHPVTNLAGKEAFYNFDGWIHSHGYPDMWVRKSQVRNMLSGDPRFAYLFQKHNISYVVIDWRLTQDYSNLNEDYFKKHPDVNIIYDTPKYRVYDVKNIQKIQ